MPNILVDDLDAVTAALRGRGVQFDGNLHGENEGYRLVTCHDPEQNALQLFEWSPPPASGAGYFGGSDLAYARPCSTQR